MGEWEDKFWDVEKDEFCDRECYEFNEKLKSQFDDRCCQHCKKYLTLQCQYLDEFMEEIDELDDYE